MSEATEKSPVIRLDAHDNVVVARVPIAKGTVLHPENIVVQSDIPLGHKLATCAIAKDEPVRKYNTIIGYATRETMILEFSSTVVALILAGKVGSSIASEIGTMRITEQIDALEIMGVNSASYLILPKIVATVLFFPFLAILSILIGIAGGYLISALTGIMIPDDYVQGLLYDFRPYSITYTLIKMAVFAFIITSISAFYGYYAKGNSLEVGAASTKAVVASSIVIMIFNLILTQILLI